VRFLIRKLSLKLKTTLGTLLSFKMNGEGFTFLEVVGTCPTNWGMTPVEASEFARMKW